MGEIYTIEHVTKSPIPGESSRWVVRGSAAGEDAPQFQVRGSQFGLIAAAGYDVKEWYNAPEHIETQLWDKPDVIVRRSMRGYYKIVDVKDKTTGRWLCRLKAEQICKGDILIMKGEGHPRHVVSRIVPTQRMRQFHFEDGGHTMMGEGQEIIVIRH